MDSLHTDLLVSFQVGRTAGSEGITADKEQQPALPKEAANEAAASKIELTLGATSHIFISLFGKYELNTREWIG